MDDIVEMSYGGVPGIYGWHSDLRRAGNDSGWRVVQVITFHSNVLTPDPNSLPTAFNVRQKIRQYVGRVGCRHPKPCNLMPLDLFLRPISYQVQSITNHKELDNG